MPQGKGTYGSQKGRPPKRRTGPHNLRTGEDFLDREAKQKTKKKKKKDKRYNPWGENATANPENMIPGP
jgi:hypothetical protein